MKGDELPRRPERVEVDRREGIVVLEDKALVEEVLAAKKSEPRRGK